MSNSKHEGSTAISSSFEPRTDDQPEVNNDDDGLGPAREALKATIQATANFLADSAPTGGPANTAAILARGETVPQLASLTGRSPEPTSPPVSEGGQKEERVLPRSSGTPWTRGVNQELMRIMRQSTYQDPNHPGHQIDHQGMTSEFNGKMQGQVVDGNLQGTRSKASVTQQLKKIRARLESEPSYDGA